MKFLVTALRFSVVALGSWMTVSVTMMAPPQERTSLGFLMTLLNSGCAVLLLNYIEEHQKHKRVEQLRK